jgi:hypothetical protein
MRGLLIVAAIAAAVTIVQSYARSEQVSGGSYLARVEEVIVEATPGVYSPRPHGARMPGVPQWVNVSFPAPLEDGRTSATARVPDLMQVEEGDLVMVRFAESGFPEAHPAVNEVSAVASEPPTWVR